MRNAGPNQTKASTVTARRRWYQRTWVWVIIGLTSAQLMYPASFMAMALATAALGDSDLARLAAVTAMWALVPISFWVGALVSERIGVRFMLLIVTAAMFLLPAWAVWSYTLGLEAEALLACQLIEGGKGEIVPLDTELCESTADGSLENRQRNIWISSAVGVGLFWVGPLAILFVLRRRFQPHGKGLVNDATPGTGPPTQSEG